MKFRFTLKHGSNTQEIAEPGGWQDHEIVLERHPEFCSLIESIHVPDRLVFVSNDNEDGNGGIDFIRTVENEGAFDESIELIVEIAADDETYEDYFRGLLKLEDMVELPENELEVPIVREDAWTTFLNRFNTPVDVTSTVDLDGNPVDPLEPVTINLTSQIIQKQFDGRLLDSRVFTQDDLSTSDYIQLDVDHYILEEFEGKNTLPIATNPEIPVGVITIEEEGEYTFDLRVEASIVFYELIQGEPCELELNVIGSTSYMEVYIQINDDTPVAFTKTSSSLILEYISTIYTYEGLMTLKKGDQVKIYGDITANINTLGEYAHLWIYSENNRANIFQPTIGINPDPPFNCFTSEAPDEEIEWHTSAPSQESIPTYFRVTAATTYPDTQVQGFWLHDLFAGVLARLGTEYEFYSEVLGSQLTKVRQYESNGCFSNFVCVKGLHIRGYTLTDDEDDPVQRYTLQEKPFFMTFKECWEGANPIFNLGLGYETLEGSPETKIIRIEGKDHFYQDPTSKDFNFVYDIKRSFDKDIIFKKVTIGYNKWESEDVSGIDDPQTRHVYATIVRGSGKDIALNSAFIAASLTIEATRRITIQKSSDYKYDNDTFIIAINIDEEISPEEYNPELDENFISITNLLYSDTRYNLVLTPMRNLLRWGNYLSGCLQSYLASSFKFVSGEGNFDMQSEYDCTGSHCQAVLCQELTESDDIPAAEFDYLHLSMIYDLRIPMDWSDYKLRDSAKKSIGISQTYSDHMKFFIKKLSYNPMLGQAEIQAWPKEYFEIQQIDTELEMEC